MEADVHSPSLVVETLLPLPVSAWISPVLCRSSAHVIAGASRVAYCMDGPRKLRPDEMRVMRSSAWEECCTAYYESRRNTAPG